MRVLVCGGRTYDNQKRVFEVLDEMHAETPIELIIEGGADGADRQARYWALSKGLPCMTMHAAWAALERQAGPIRNLWMVRFGQPDTVVAFPGGRGTENMLQTAVAMNVGNIIHITQ